MCSGWLLSQCCLRYWAPGSGKQEVWGSRGLVMVLCSPSVKAASWSSQNSPSRKRKDCCQTREKEEKENHNQLVPAENVKLKPTTAGAGEQSSTFIQVRNLLSSCCNLPPEKCVSTTHFPQKKTRLKEWPQPQIWVPNAGLPKIAVKPAPGHTSR